MVALPEQYTAVAQYMFADARQQTEENGQSNSASSEPTQTEQEQQQLLIRDAMSALSQPHHIYVYFHKSVHRVRTALSIYLPI
jgi:hypothetical protein